MRQQVISFIEKYQKMRSAQKKYFKTKDQVHLIESKKLETENDIEADRLLPLLKKQQ